MNNTSLYRLVLGMNYAGMPVKCNRYQDITNSVRLIKLLIFYDNVWFCAMKKYPL